jgi:hypothetical protein
MGLAFLPVVSSHGTRHASKAWKNPCVIFDASTKSYPHKVVLNEITTTEFKANINFGQAKIKLLTRIYNWRIANPKRTLYLALADITACF